METSLSRDVVRETRAPVFVLERRTFSSREKRIFFLLAMETSSFLGMEIFSFWGMVTFVFLGTVTFFSQVMATFFSLGRATFSLLAETFSSLETVISSFWVRLTYFFSGLRANPFLEVTVKFFSAQTSLCLQCSTLQIDRYVTLMVS